MIHSQPVRAWLPGLPGFRLFTSFWGSLMAVDVAGTAPDWVAVLLVGVVVVLSSLGQRAGVALTAGGIGWLVVTGFVVNDFGVLTLSGGTDPIRLGVLLAVAVLGSSARGLRRRAALTPVEPAHRRTSRTQAGAAARALHQAGAE